MPIQQELIALANPAQWRAALREVPHAFGHTWESCHALQQTTGQPVYLYQLHGDGARVVCPLVERSHQGLVDIATPPGFTGFTGTAPVADFARHWQHFAQARGYVCGYIGLNPLLDPPDYFDPRQLHPAHRLYGLDLQRPVAELFGQLSANRKVQLKTYPTAAESMSWDKALGTDFFLRHVRAFLEARRASAASHYSPKALTYLLGLDNVLVASYIAGGEVQAVSVFGHTAFVADYLFNVSVPAGQAHAALLLWHGIQRLRALGLPVLNLGGGIRESDGVAEFKRRFGARQVLATCARQVYDPARYEALCRQAGADPAVGTGGYFPPYRQPHLPLSLP